MARGSDSTPTVTEREERTHVLFTRLEESTDTCSQHEIVAEIAELNLALSDALARRYARRGSDSGDDLTQVARTGLLLAIHRYRSGEDTSFVRFAVPTITGELKRYFRDHCWAVRPPRAIQELRPQVEGAREELTQEMGREPRDVDVARRIGTDARSVRKCTEAANGFRTDSLDAPVFNGGPCLGDALASTVGDPETCVSRVVLRRAMATLTSRERRVLGWRFCDDLTQAEIGDLLGVSQMQVSRILRAALARLRSMLIPGEEPDAA